MKTRRARDPYGGADPRQVPAYDAFAAAHYLRIPKNTIRGWAFGRAYPTRTGGLKMAAPLIEVADAKDHFLSFANLIELHVLGALRREHQVEMVKIRRAIEYLQKELNTPRPLLDVEMETDGTDIFVDRIVGGLINVSRSGQFAMKEMFHAHLKRIERDAAGIPIRLFPFTRPKAKKDGTHVESPRFVAIDPAVAFGRPVITGSRVPTVEVFERFRMGEQPDELAADFARSLEEILEAIRCEAEAA
jgi:uncharacterized protein (DUF433 family)